MARRGFGNDGPPAIPERLKSLYVTPRLQELDQALLRLHDPMDRNQPVQVMIYTTEEVQIFLMAHLYGYPELSDLNLISYMLIKLSKCNILYIKTIERW